MTKTDAPTVLEQTDLPVAIPHVEAPVAAEYIQAETFLENSGYFTPSSKRIRGIYEKEKRVGEKLMPDGSRQAVKVRISANHSLGLPITSDEDFYRGFQRICDEIVDRDGRFRMPIEVSTRKLIRYAGKKENARVWKEAREWFKRMTLTGIEGGVYRAKRKDFDDGFVGTVFSQVVMRGERMRNGKTAETNYVWLAPWFLSNYFHRHTRPIDYELYQRLRKPIAKSLYTILGSGWYASGGKPYAKSYQALCDEFLLRRHQQISYVRQQLDPSHKELRREQFLERWEYRKASKKDDYVIVYFPGKKFFESAQQRKERKELAARIAIIEDIASGTQLDLLEPLNLLIEDILAICGDPENTAAYRKLTEKHSESLLRMALSETKQAHLEGRIQKTKGAYFTDTVQRLSQLRKAASSTTR